MTEHFELTPPPIDTDDKIFGNVGEFFASFIAIQQQQLIDQGIDEAKAKKMVSHMVYNLSVAFGGETFYVTKKPQVFARQMQIYSDLKTMPSSDVDKKYGLSQGYSLKIKKEIDEKIYHRQQLTLF